MPATRAARGRQAQAGIGAQYLEKMLQLKIAVPALAVPEVITYVNLLLAELHLPAKTRPAARARRRPAGHRLTGRGLRPRYHG